MRQAFSGQTSGAMEPDKQWLDLPVISVGSLSGIAFCNNCNESNAGKRQVQTNLQHFFVWATILKYAKWLFSLLLAKSLY
jgi:hypothetical protein